jgi:hypothetical protein
MLILPLNQVKPPLLPASAADPGGIVLMLPVKLAGFSEK